MAPMIPVHHLSLLTSFGKMLHYLRRNTRLTQHDLAIVVGHFALRY
jgi:hypothetical protein